MNEKLLRVWIEDGPQDESVFLEIAPLDQGDSEWIEIRTMNEDSEKWFGKVSIKLSRRDAKWLSRAIAESVNNKEDVAE